MIKTGRVILIIIVLLLVSFPVLSGNNRIIMAADSWPPFADPDATGEGLCIRIVRAAFESQGFEVVMHFLPWTRALVSLQAGSVEVIPTIWMNSERAEKYYFSDPYLINTVVFLKRASDRFEYAGLESLNGKTIGLIRGYSYDEEFLAATNYQKVTVSSLVQNLLLLTSYRIDLSVDDFIVARMLLNRQDESLKNGIAFAETPLSQKELYIATSRDNPRGREIIDIFNAGLKEIGENGFYDALIREYNIPSESVPVLE